MYRGGGGESGGGGVVMTRDPKPRLRWTADLHDRFVDAVTKLGGPDSKSHFFQSKFCLVMFMEHFHYYH